MTATHKTKLVYIVYGNPGAGKSTVAESLATSMPQSILLSIDKIRENFRYPPTNSVCTQEIYSFVAKEAGRHLDQELTVIIDATFYSRRYRLTVFEYLRAYEPTYVLVQIATPIDTCRKRIRLRTSDHNLQGMSDISSFERCAAATDAWMDDEIPNDWYRVTIDCSDEEPRVLKYSQAIPANIIQNVLVALGGKPHGI